MSAVTFSVVGDPMGKKRAKFARRGKFVHTYSPKENVDYEQRVRDAYKGNPSFGDEPLKVEIYALYPIPKSITKKKLALIQDGKLLPCSKPDVDNVSKIILDALNGVAYNDDKQVVLLTIKKLYSETPRVEVSIDKAI